jgi:hypothetical protein
MGIELIQRCWNDRDIAQIGEFVSTAYDAFLNDSRFPRAVRAAVTVRMADVIAEKLEWLWPGRIALGKLTLPSGGGDAASTAAEVRQWLSEMLSAEPVPAEELLQAASEGDHSQTSPRCHEARRSPPKGRLSGRLDLVAEMSRPDLPPRRCQGATLCEWHLGHLRGQGQFSDVPQLAVALDGSTSYHILSNQNHDFAR